MKRISYFDLNEEYEPKASFSFISLHLIGAECQRKNLMRTNIWNKRRQCSTSAKSAISARNQSRTNVSQPVFMRKVGKQYERERERILIWLKTVGRNNVLFVLLTHACV